MTDKSPGSSMASGWGVRLFVGVAVSVVFIYVLYGLVDFAEVVRILNAARPEYLAGAVFCLAAAYGLKIARWFVMLRQVSDKIDYSACVAPFMVSIALNNLLPMRAGDAARVLAFRARLGASGMTLLGTLVVERVLDLVVLLAVFATVSLFLAEGAVPAAVQSAASTLTVAAAAGVVAVLLLPGPARKLLAKLGDAAPAARNVLAKVGETLGVIGTLCRPSRIPALLGLSVAAWVCEGGVFVLTALALGWQGGVIASFFGLAVGTLSTLVPSSPGYIGTFHYFTSQAYVFFGAGENLATAIAVAIHLILWTTTTVVGLAFLLAKFLRPAPDTGTVRQSTIL